MAQIAADVLMYFKHATNEIQSAARSRQDSRGSHRPAAGLFAPRPAINSALGALSTNPFAQPLHRAGHAARVTAASQASTETPQLP